MSTDAEAGTSTVICLDFVCNKAGFLVLGAPLALQQSM